MENKTYSKKNLEQFALTKSGIKLFYSKVEQATNYDELLQLTNNLAIYFQKIANEKNQTTNKSLFVFIEYFRNESLKQRSLERVTTIAKAKRLNHKSSYKDYLSEYIILRDRGYSFKKIADYSNQHYKTKVSKETIRNFLKANNQEKGE